MGKVFDGSLISYTTRLNVVDEIKKGLPRTFALAIGAALLWMFLAVVLGLYTALRAGQFSDRFLTVLALVGMSMPVFWVGALMNYFLGFKWGIFPNGGYVPFAGVAVAVVLPPDHALDGAVAAVHRRLLARAALERPGHDERRLRAHRAGQGALRAPGDAAARAAQLDDPDHHAVGPGLRRGARRRRDPDRDRVRPPGRRPVRARVGAEPGPGGAGHDHAVRRLLHRVPEHDRGHRLRRPRSRGSGSRERARCCRSRTWRSPSRPRRGRSPPSTACRWSWRRARSWRWWGSPARASRSRR